MIFTLNARGNLLWEIITDHFRLDSNMIRKEINISFDQLIKVLNIKGINYSDLKTALVPSLKKRETMFVFNTMKIENGFYGGEIFENIIPYLKRESNHSILLGDYIGDNNHQRLLHDILLDQLKVVRPIEYINSGQYFLFYINNLTDSAHSDIIKGFDKYLPFVGYVDMTFSSPLKTYVSTILCNAFIKNRNKIIMPHPDDVDNSENENTANYPFEKYNYSFLSIQQNLFNSFLSYKIECPIHNGTKRDVDFSINAISSEIYNLDDLDVLVEEKKLEYLLKEKAGLMKKANFKDIKTEDFEKQIAERISESYLFNLEYLMDHNTSKFNIMLEFHTPVNRIKLQLALEYKADEKKLRLITLV